MSITLAAAVYAALTLFAALFQLALASGMPWGHLAMGGKFPGVFSLQMRLAAFFQMALLLLILGVVLVRAHWWAEGWFAFSEKAIWWIVGLNGLSLVMNLLTPSRPERWLWSPVALGMLATSLFLALS